MGGGRKNSTTHFSMKLKGGEYEQFFDMVTSNIYYNVLAI